MIDSELTYATAETQTFVNFKEKQYLSCRTSYKEVLIKQLFDKGFVSIDEAIAYPVIVLNDNGCVTQYSCSGHIGGTKNMYIMFSSITTEFKKRFEESKFWKYDDNNNNIIYRAKFSNYGEWLASLNDLYKIVENKSHEFKEYCVVQTEYNDGLRKYSIIPHDEIKTRYSNIDPTGIYSMYII